MILSGQFSNVQDLNNVHLTCKFQEHPINTEHVMVMTVKQEAFSAIKGMFVTLRLIIQSGQILNLSEISSMSNLSALGRSDQKLTELC